MFSVTLCVSVAVDDFPNFFSFLPVETRFLYTSFALRHFGCAIYCDVQPFSQLSVFSSVVVQDSLCCFYGSN